MKSKLLAVILSATLLANPVASFAGGIPTVDAAALAQWVNQANQMAEQIKQFEQQIQNQIDHLNAIKGARGVGKVDAVMNALENAPDEWADIYKTVQNIDPTKTLNKIQIDPNLEIKQAQALKENAIADYNKISGIFKDLESIARDIKSGKIQDAKDAADLTNRIQLQTAMITAMNAKYDMLEKQMREQERLQSKKAVNRNYCIRAAKTKAERNRCEN